MDNIIINPASARFSEAYFYEPNVEVILLGVGGIGSWVALNLARLECKIHMFDHDTVEDVNMAGQFYDFNNINLPKTNAVKKNILMFSSADMESFIKNEDNYIEYDKYTKDSIVGPIMFSCFDNMAARKLAFEKWASEDDREIFIDGRMALVTGEVYCVIKGREKEYEETLFDDSEVEDAPCSMKASTFSAMTIAGLITGLYCNYIGIRKNPDLPMQIPFKITYNFPLMMFI